MAFLSRQEVTRLESEFGGDFNTHQLGAHGRYCIDRIAALEAALAAERERRESAEAAMASIKNGRACGSCLRVAGASVVPYAVCPACAHRAKFGGGARTHNERMESSDDA